MLYIAFSLGLFGSLHCLGMCGPLAIAFSNRAGNTKLQDLLSALSYNLGRTTMYTLLGVIFGLLGSLFFIADLQKGISIVLGIILVASFVFSIDIDHKINSSTYMGKLYANVRAVLSKMMSKSKSYHPFTLGLANGLLPCGLVYLALAGALANGSIIGGGLFMTFFGLGTIPMLLALTTTTGIIPYEKRALFRKMLPYVTLFFGIFLIYRGIMVDVPLSLNFWEAYHNPIMCH